MRPVVVVCGSRYMQLNDSQKEWLARELYRLQPSMVIHGGSTGVDNSAHHVATAAGFTVKVYAAQWDEHGRAAGPIRNKQMAKLAHVCIHFPGGTGTANMIKNAREQGLTLIEGPKR